jgi:DNA-binding MarR family transcriptional regulator
MTGEEDPGREAWTLLFELFRSLRPEFAALQAETGLNMAQIHLLKHLGEPGGQPMSQLAEQLFCDASYVTGLVDKLEAKGLVRRLPNPVDRRVKLIALTEAGTALRNELEERSARPPTFIEALSAEDKRALRDIFVKAKRNIPTG